MSWSGETVPEFPPLDFRGRRAAAQARLNAHGASALVVPVSADLEFLTGLSIKKSERPVLLVLHIGNEPILVCPTFERDRIIEQVADISVRTYEEGEDPFQIAAAQLEGARKIVISERAWFAEVQGLASALPQAVIESGEGIMSPLRWCKGEPELARLGHAIGTWQQVLGDVLADLEPGMRGGQIKQAVVNQLTAAGGMAPSCSVNIGPSAAQPHGSLEELTLQRGGVLLIDGGIAFGGYRSDLTRTYTLRSPPEKVRTVMEVVLAAQSAAIESIGPGVAAETVDRAARQVIHDAGYGESFTHRVGHGLGLEGHEPPYLVLGNRQPLEPGMVVTIEPGIYLSGEFGVRIEDDVLVTEEGAQILSNPVDSVESLIV